MKRILTLAFFSGIVIFFTGCKLSIPSATVLTETIEKFHKALIDPDSAILSGFVSDSLSYGHSSGKVENKEQFISTLTTGASNFLSITITNQQVTLFSTTAIVRHDLEAAIHDKDKPAMTIHLRILMVWQIVADKWVLIARQAVKI